MQTTNANLAPRCSHVHDGGQPCGSPALRDHEFCYFHERLHHPPAHPVKTPVAFIPPLESPEALQIAATNIAPAVGMGQLTDKQARNMNASLRMARWAIEQRAKAAAEGNQPDPITELPDPMAKVLTAAHTEIEPEVATTKCGTDIPVGRWALRGCPILAFFWQGWGVER